VGGLSRLYLDGLLKKAGLKETDVVVRAMAFNEMVGALSQGAVDVAFLVQPFITIVEERGIGVGIAELWDLFPGHMTNNLFYSDTLMRKRPAVAEKFIAGFLRGQRHFYDAAIKKKGVFRKRRGYGCQILSHRRQKVIKLGSQRHGTHAQRRAESQRDRRGPGLVFSKRTPQSKDRCEQDGGFKIFTIRPANVGTVSLAHLREEANEMAVREAAG